MVVLRASGDGSSRDGRGHAREQRWWLNGWQGRVVTKGRRRKRRKKKKPMKKMKPSDFFIFERKMKLERWKGKEDSGVGWGSGKGKCEEGERFWLEKKRGGEVGKTTWKRGKVLE